MTRTPSDKAPAVPRLSKTSISGKKSSISITNESPSASCTRAGLAAHGYFETLESLSDVTSADVFQSVGEKTAAFVRFSTVAGSRGSFDLARDVRGFAVKIYTHEGNWDLVGNNIPVFFIQDAIKFPDVIHSVKPAPDRGFPQAQSAHDNFWDFISLTPESMHMIMWVMSDRAIPRSFRFMEGFGVHTFRFLNDEGKSTFVKFHWKPKLGLQSVTWNEAVKINGADPDFHRRDLWDAIVSGSFPEWDLGIQLFDDDFAESFEFDILDPTKIIPEEVLPIRVVGRLVLDRVVDNFFAETQQVAFMTQNVPPGIDFSNLYDAVAVLCSKEGAKLLAMDKAAKDFVSDAFAHCKFIGYVPDAGKLLEAAGLADSLDGGCFELSGKVDEFISALGDLRLWDREALVDLDAHA